MSKIFIGGSRQISQLNAEVQNRLQRIITKHLDVIVGDANGADKAVQSYFSEHQYHNVVVYCTADECRNNLGNWRVATVGAPHRTRDFEFFAAKDAAMAAEADFGFMLWDGKSVGTLVNVARMVARRKPVVLFSRMTCSFRTLRSPEALAAVLSICPAEVRRRIETYIAEHLPQCAQPSMFDAR
jgi:adenine-specific DNA-methyltransferase